MRAGKVTRPDRITPSVPLHTTFLLLLAHLFLALCFPASFLCLVLPMWSPSSSSWMGKVNDGARAAHINSTLSLFTFPLPLSRVSPFPLSWALFLPSRLCNQSRTQMWSWLRVSLGVGVTVVWLRLCDAPDLSALPHWGKTTPGAHMPVDTTCSCINDDL